MGLCGSAMTVHSEGLINAALMTKKETVAPSRPTKKKECSHKYDLKAKENQDRRKKIPSVIYAK